MWFIVKLSSEIRKINKLSAQDKDRMFELMQTYYENVNQSKFLKDLHEKDGVLLLTTENNKIQGFSTYLIIETNFNNETIYALYSGDTIVDQKYWGQIALFRSFANLIKQFLEDSYKPLYWFLLSKGIKTYLLLPLYFKSYYPQAGKDTSNYLSLINHLGKLRFGDFFHAEKGIVRIEPPADHLKEHLTVIPKEKLKNPHVKLFLDRNPGFVNGDELVCLTNITENNLTRAASKFVNRK